MKGVLPLPCARCLGCRKSRAVKLAHRIMLEKMSHPSAVFATVTYRDEEVRDVSSAEWVASRPVVGTLVPDDLQLFLKRLRRAVSPLRLRFFATGEYGDVKARPHYHLALFGFPECFNGKTVYSRSDTTGEKCCPPCGIVAKAWGLGRVELNELNERSAAYVAGYITKKFKKEDLWQKKKLNGRHPEFVRMSLKPGIGADAILSLVTSGVRSRQGKWLNKCLDAPVVLRSGGSLLPLGRYLRRKWREALGRSPETPPGLLEEYVSGLQGLRDVYREEVRGQGTPPSFADARSHYFSENAQKIKNMESRFKIWQSRGQL